MDKFVKLTGVAAPLPVVNIDTDMIIPKDYLKTIKRTGLGKGLFAEARYNEDGSVNESFVLNKPAYQNASILVAGDNFGCGSSREHAPWALLDFGIRCVISTSFADIFYNNCFKNGILPIVVSQDDLDKLMDDASRGSNAILTVDLEAQEITGPDGGRIGFEIDAFRRHCLLNGLDDIGLTLEKATSIDSFEKQERKLAPLGLKAMRRLISSGSPFEVTAGYSRAVVQGDWCFVSGTTGYDYTTMTMPEGVEAQTRTCLATIGEVLQEAGFSFAEVVRCHYYVTDAAFADRIFPILGETFRTIRPAATMVVCDLIRPEMLIEIEVTALRAS